MRDRDPFKPAPTKAKQWFRAGENPVYLNFFTRNPGKPGPYLGERCRSSFAALVLTARRRRSSSSTLGTRCAASTRARRPRTCSSSLAGPRRRVKSAIQRQRQRTYCYKIHSIHGQRDVDPGQLTAKKRRNAIDDADYEDAYLVHGDFGEDADDDGYKDTRWVLLSDILNLSART